MKSLFKILFFSCYVTILVVFSIATSYLLPYPFSGINIILGILILSILWKNNGIIVWISFFSYFTIELFSVTPFGIILFSGTMCILFSLWLYRHILNNRTWYVAIILTFFTLLIYYILYLLTISILQIFGVITLIPWGLIIINFLWELLFTSLFVVICYLILWHFFHAFNASVVESRVFKINLPNN